MRALASLFLALLSLDTGVRTELVSFCSPAVVKVVSSLVETSDREKKEKVSSGN